MLMFDVKLVCSDLPHSKIGFIDVLVGLDLKQNW